MRGGARTCQGVLRFAHPSLSRPPRDGVPLDYSPGNLRSLEPQERATLLRSSICPRARLRSVLLVRGVVYVVVTAVVSSLPSWDWPYSCAIPLSRPCSSTDGGVNGGRRPSRSDA